MTIPEMLHHTVAHQPHKAALLYKVAGDPHHDGHHGAEAAWHPITYTELAERVRALALGLVDLGLAPGSRVALLSENRPEWAIADLAIVSIGAVNVPLYTTLPPAQVEYIVEDSEAEFLIVSNARQLAKAQEVRARLPRLKQVIVMDPPASLPEGVLTFDDVLARAGKHPDHARFAELEKAVTPDQLATIIYTSGTTGAPKGAMLTHNNFMSNAQSVATLVEVLPTDMFLSFLPLSHIFERMAGHYLPLAVGCTVAYAESVFTVQSNMVEMKPTVMASVPRLYESIHSRVADGIAKQPPKERKTAEWALEVGWEYNRLRVAGEPIPLTLRAKYEVANALVLSKIRERVTGGKLRFFISGGAPLPVKTAEFLTALGLHILEGYGLTETSPVICVNRPEMTCLGTVGPPIPGVEVKIAADGEILSRGPHIMTGYYNKPEETAQAIDAEGWFHTGDIGRLEENGYLKITDRKKDIIVLANGKNVAPQPIEARLKASPYIGSVVLFGDRQPQIVALVVPDFEHLKRWAREQGLETKDTEALVKDAKVQKLIRDEITAQSKDLADFESVRRFALLSRDFSQERDEITPTLKIKRKVVAEHFAEEIRGLYGVKE